MKSEPPIFFLVSLLGLLGLGGLMWAIAALWPHPHEEIVQAVLITHGDVDPSTTELCYAVEKYEVLGFRWGEATISPPEQDQYGPYCPGRGQVLIFDCLGAANCPQVVKRGLVKRPIVTNEELLEQQKTAPSGDGSTE